jgi:aspartyl-tRNA(Asn)/glutamyl-tRNA(Gln) amidotransferase subunit B
LPLTKRNRFLKEYKLSETEADIITANLWLAGFFESACKSFNEPQKISNWLLGPFLEQAKLLPEGFNSVKISGQNFAKIVKYFAEDRLNNLAAKKVLSLRISDNQDIDELIAKEGLLQVSDTSELTGLVREAIKENPKAVKEFLQGQSRALMFLVGCVMKKSKGKANPKIVGELLEKELKNSKST